MIRIKRSHWFVAALHISAAAPALCRAALRIASPIINRPIHLTFIYRLEYRSRLAQIFKRVMIAPGGLIQSGSQEAICLLCAHVLSGL